MLVLAAQAHKLVAFGRGKCDCRISLSALFLAGFCNPRPDRLAGRLKLTSEIVRVAASKNQIEHLRKRDVLVVPRLESLARSTAELLRIAERLTEKSVGLQLLDEPWADTTSLSGRMVMTTLAGIAKFERTLIISRTTDGRVAAKARGVTFGRPKKIRLDQQELARCPFRDRKSIIAVARTFNVHPATI